MRHGYEIPQVVVEAVENEKHRIWSYRHKRKKMKQYTDEDRRKDDARVAELNKWLRKTRIS